MTKPDNRLSCPYCHVKTWMTDYEKFMSDHDRADGRRCRKAAESVATSHLKFKKGDIIRPLPSFTSSPVYWAWSDIVQVKVVQTRKQVGGEYKIKVSTKNGNEGCAHYARGFIEANFTLVEPPVTRAVEAFLKDNGRI